MIKMIGYFLYSGYLVLLLGILGGRMTENFDIIRLITVCLLIFLVAMLICYSYIFKLSKIDIKSNEMIKSPKDKFWYITKLLAIPMFVVILIGLVI